MTNFIKPKNAKLTLLSGEDINLSEWIISQDILLGDVEITIPAGEIIGGTRDDNYALNIGDISQFMILF